MQRPRPLQLQKSQYGLRYYINVALWLLALGEAQFPKERTCHVRSRLSRVLGRRGGTSGESTLPAVFVFLV
ncbi:MAG: hypothetical protein DLM55_09900 [Acidimicrobiales bacterium]|nr:MAG: hypothetical protein DLM55_09900 [Acidimicrobiales bacterium]